MGLRRGNCDRGKPASAFPSGTSRIHPFFEPDRASASRRSACERSARFTNRQKKLRRYYYHYNKYINMLNTCRSGRVLQGKKQGQIAFEILGNQEVFLYVSVALLTEARGNLGV